MKMVVVSADEHEKLKNEKKEAVDKLESYKQCAAGYESRIKELTEELEKLKNAYCSTSIKKVLNGVYGTERDVCCRISNGLNKSMFDKITELSDENEKLKDENQSLKYRIGLFETELLTKNATLGKLEKENKKLKASTVSFECHKKLIEDNEKLGEKYHKLEVKAASFDTILSDYSVVLKEKETLISAIKNDNYMCGQIIEDYTKKIKELKQKYEAVLKANEKLAAENQRLTNNPETTKLSNELSALKKQYRDLNNAYKSQKNTLHELTKSSDDAYDVLRSQYSFLHKDYERVILLREEAIKEIKSLKTRLSHVATKVAKIYNNTKVDTYTLDTLVEDLKAYI